MKNASWMGRRWAILLAGGLLLSGCLKEEEKPKDAGATAAKQALPSEIKTTLKASEDDCVGPLVRTNKPRAIEFGDHRFTLDGYLLSQLDQDPDDEVIVGVISDTKEASPENHKNIEKVIGFFKHEKAQVIIHLGDIAGIMLTSGDVVAPDKDEKGNLLTEEQKSMLRRRMMVGAREEAVKKSLDGLVENISLLAETNLPVLVISGNRECKTTFNGAMATLAKDFPNVFNMNLIRRADLDDVVVISMPGYHDPEYVHCPWDRCLYYESDTLSLIDLAKETTKPVLVISHGPPRQKDRNGIDVVSEGANVGNPWLTTAIAKAGIPFGAFGNIQEAGGKATNLDGTSIIAQNTFVDSLYLNPGPSDSMAWGMNDGTESRGMAAVIHFVGKKANYKIYRVGEEEKALGPAPEKGTEKAPEKGAEKATPKAP